MTREALAKGLSENVEMYLVTVYRLTENGGEAKTTDVANYWGVSPASATEMIHKLSRLGLAVHRPYHGTTLTDKGVERARVVIRKHRLAERFLVDVIGVRGNEKIHDYACRLEHTMPDELEAWICTTLGHPAENHAGKPIPAGPCCKTRK
ncbi:MAG: metal-dependent transcriptional regulator [Methanobacteriota archaeon]